jgi:hypothetical protein
LEHGRNGYVVEFETHVEAAVKLLSPPLTTGGALLRYYCLRTISKGWRDGTSEWGAMMAAREEIPPERHERRKRETHRERHRHTETFQETHKRGGSLENPGPPCTRRAKSSVDSPRHCDDNDAGSPSFPLSHGSIHTATITGAGGKRVGDSPARRNERW